MVETLGFNIWTKNPPKEYLELYPAVAQNQQLPIIAIVDDVLPAVVFDRSPKQTDTFNIAYRDYMKRAGYDAVHFVSELLPERDQDLVRIYNMSDRITISVFMGLLPEIKREKLDSLKLTETIDTCWQLSVLEAGIARLGISRYLTGKRSTALFRLAKDIIPSFQFATID